MLRVCVCALHVKVVRGIRLTDYFSGVCVGVRARKQTSSGGGVIFFVQISLSVRKKNNYIFFFSKDSFSRRGTEMKMNDDFSCFEASFFSSASRDAERGGKINHWDSFLGHGRHRITCSQFSFLSFRSKKRQTKCH